MTYSIRTLLVSVCCVAVLLAAFVHLQWQRKVAAAKTWILNQDGAYCLTEPCPNAARTGDESRLYAYSLYGIHGDEYSNPVKEVAFEFATLYTFEPLTCFRKIERISVETVMSGDIDMKQLAKLPKLSEISFCKESRNTPGFDRKITELKESVPGIKIEFDTPHFCRRMETRTEEWVVNAGKGYGG